MNRFSCKCLAALCLLCALALPACAEIDLAPYELPGTASDNTLIRLTDENHVLAVRNYDYKTDTPPSLTLIENGEATLTLPLNQNLRYTPFALPGGRCGVTALDDRDVQIQLLENGALSPVLTLPWACNGDYVLADEGVVQLRTAFGEAPQVERYDWDGQLLSTTALPFDHRHLSYDVCFAPDGGFTLLVDACERADSCSSGFRLLRISPDGEVQWISEIPLDEECDFGLLHPDGQGSYFLLARWLSDYKVRTLSHLNASGEVLWQKTLRADRAIMNPAFIQPNEDGTFTLYGDVVAHSRRLYTVFAMTIDAQGSTLALDVRDFTTRADYNYGPYRAPDGRIFAKSGTSDANGENTFNGALVPFDDLPAAKDPGITLR